MKRAPMIQTRAFARPMTPLRARSLVASSPPFPAVFLEAVPHERHGEEDDDEGQEDDPGHVDDPLYPGRERQDPKGGLNDREPGQRNPRPADPADEEVVVPGRGLFRPRLEAPHRRAFDDPHREDPPEDDRQADEVLREPVVVKLPLQDIPYHRLLPRLFLLRAGDPLSVSGDLPGIAQHRIAHPPCRPT
jgi:hypothetical protein